MADQENKKKARRRLSRVKVSAGIGEKLDALADQIEGGNDGGKNSDSMSKGRRMSTRVLQAHKIYEGDKVERTRGSKTRLARLSSEAKMKEPNEASTTPKEADTNVAPQTSEPVQAESGAGTAEPPIEEKKTPVEGKEAPEGEKEAPIEQEKDFVEEKEAAVPEKEDPVEGKEAHVEVKEDAQAEEEAEPEQKETSAKQAPAEEAPAEEAPAEEAPAQQASAEDKQEAPADEKETFPEQKEVTTGVKEASEKAAPEPEQPSAVEPAGKSAAAEVEQAEEKQAVAAEGKTTDIAPSEESKTEKVLEPVERVLSSTNAITLDVQETKVVTVEKAPFGLTASNLLVIRTWGESKSQGVAIGDKIVKVNDIPVKTNSEMKDLFANTPLPFPMELLVGTEKTIKKAKAVLARLEVREQEQLERDRILSRRNSEARPADMPRKGNVELSDTVVKKNAFLGKGRRFLKLYSSCIFYSHEEKALDTREKMDGLKKEFNEMKGSKGKTKVKGVVVIPLASITKTDKTSGGGIILTVGEGKSSRKFTFEAPKDSTDFYDKWAKAIKAASK